MLFAVPRKWVCPSLLDVGKGHVAAVTNNMDDQSVGNLALDFRNVQQVIRRTVGPALHALVARGLFHYDAQKISGAVAVAHNFSADIFGIEAGDLKQAALEPQAKEISAVALGT